MPDQLPELVKRGRERLVDELLESLNEPAATELNAAREAEIEKRLAEYDQGDVKAVEGAEVFARARLLAQ